MAPSASSHLLFCSSEQHGLNEVRRLLAPAGHTVASHMLGSPDPEQLTDYRMVLVEGAGAPDLALGLCRRLRVRLEASVVPIVYLTQDASPAARLATLEAGADTYLLRPFAPGELLAQVSALLRIKDAHDRLEEKTVQIHRINRQLQQVHQQIDHEMELAQRIQSSFLPQSLPRVPGLRFAVKYQLCGRVGGDFYDVSRLDERHVALYVADAMGHGVPASLLTIFIKTALRAKEVSGSEYRLVPPAEVLGRLNRKLIEQELAESPFITMVYALLDHETGTIEFARAGHPYPLYVPAEGPAEFWQQEGLLLGVVPANFQAKRHTLRRGDKLLLYSDGIDSAEVPGAAKGAPSLLACAERHRALPAVPFVENIFRDLFTTADCSDDLTLLAVEVGD